MPLAIHPFALGLMLVVAVGTFAITLWSQNQQQQTTYGHSSQNRTFVYETPRSTITLDNDESGKRSKKKMQNGDCCSICLGSWKGQQKTLICSHTFHPNCIMAWLVNNNTCPICRTIQKR